MANLKTRSLGESVPCDFCNEQVAIFYCRADSAKLCLICDRHVHSANALSRKHVRSQICDNCGSKPVSVRCVTDNLVLCQDCDWDAHGSCAVSASHDRNPVEGFSGCPSAVELASVWGIEIQDKKPNVQVDSSSTWENGFSDSWMAGKEEVSASVLLNDLMVPNHYHHNPAAALIYSNCGGELLKKQNPSCGKQKQVIMKQLVGLLETDLVDVGGCSCGGGGDELGPETPNVSGGGVWQEYEEAGGGLKDVDEGAVGIANQPFQQNQQNAPFMSLLMMQTPANPNHKENDRMIEGSILWNSTPCDQATQVSFSLFAQCYCITVFIYLFIKKIYIHIGLSRWQLKIYYSLWILEIVNSIFNSTALLQIAITFWELGLFCAFWVY